MLPPGGGAGALPFPTWRQIVAAIDERGLTTPAEVAAATGAGSGCGGCSGSVASILAELESGRIEELRYARLSRRR